MRTSSKQLFDSNPPRKALIFVSPGRCGTTRLAEILRDTLPQEEFAVTHQMLFSRLANIVGNLMFHFGQSEKIKEKLYSFIVSQYVNDKHFITTDPLTAMIIPKKWVESQNVCIIQITRNPDEFAESFYRFSRKKVKSFLAHNFIPFWQPSVLPLENIFHFSIQKKYKFVNQKKKGYFDSFYSVNQNYLTIDITELFHSEFLKNLIQNFFNFSVDIDSKLMICKSNTSTS